MPLGTRCVCLLCQVESQLLAEFKLNDVAPQTFLLESPDHQRLPPSIPLMLAELRASAADSRSDELFHRLFVARETNPRLVETFLVLAFLPMLHHTIRRVAKHQPALSPDDITQQALTTLLQFLRSDEIRMRASHFAFAISRAVKRGMFEWANREGSVNGARADVNGDFFAALTTEETFERHALLRHFLARCISKGLLTGAEIDLLIHFKLGQDNENFLNGDSDVKSSNAVRQRLKRLLAKLRRLAMPVPQPGVQRD